MEYMRIVLCDEKTPHLRINVVAEVLDVCLKISGQDLGKTVEDITGKEECEYFYKFDQENTSRLFALLSHESQTAKENFMRKFSGVDGCRVLRKF